MSLKIKVAGVNAFLETIYGPDSRPSTLLQALGCTSEQVTLLRTRSLEAFIDGFVQCIAERLAQYGGGERRYRVLARRLGLDGENPAPLGELGVELGVSRERVRQIQEGTVQRCRSRKQCHYWLEALYSCAADLLTGEGIALCPFDPERATRLIERAMPSAARVPMPATPTERGESAIDPSPDVWQETADRLNDTINAIFAIAGDDIADSILTDLLLGSTRPVIAALVGHYSLQFSHGAFEDIDRKRIKTLVRDARRAAQRPTAPTAQHEDAALSTVDEPEADDLELEEVACLVAEIDACIGRHLSSTMCAHILHGGHGPRVDALVQMYRPPHYGRLRPLGIKRVQELTKGAYARAAYNQTRTNGRDSMTTTTIELPDDVRTQAEALATTTGRSLAEVLTEAVVQGLAYEQWFREQVEEGQRSAREEPLIPADQVWDDFLRHGLLTPEAIAEAEEDNKGRQYDRR